MFGRLSSAIINNRQRMNETTYNSVVSFLTSKFDALDINYVFIKELSEKKSFDKVTVLVDIEHLAQAQHALELALDFERCANTYSYLLFDYSHVDIIAVKAKDFHIQSFLYDYDDFGWLVQRCLEKHNSYFLFDDGLYTKYHAHYISHMIYLTNDLKTILGICQLDYDVYKNGFETYDSMFKYIADCPIFDQSLFELKNMPKRTAAKFKKHILYRKLNKFMDKYDIPEVMPGKLIYPSMMFEKEIETTIELIENQRNAVIKLKNHFNGNIVSSVTGMTHPKDLGNFMKIIRAKYTDEELIADAVNIIKREYKERVM